MISFTSNLVNENLNTGLPVIFFRFLSVLQRLNCYNYSRNFLIFVSLLSFIAYLLHFQRSFYKMWNHPLICYYFHGQKLPELIYPDLLHANIRNIETLQKKIVIPGIAIFYSKRTFDLTIFFHWLPFFNVKSSFYLTLLYGRRINRINSSRPVYIATLKYNIYAKGKVNLFRKFKTKICFNFN